MAALLYDPNAVGYIHSVETGGMVDGPGIRYVVFFSGCPLRCKYCHNPDTWRMKDGHQTTVEEILRDMKKYQSYLRFSGGGVTITGGDPFSQPKFLMELLRACKHADFHVCLDTAGFTPADTVQAALAYTDLLLLDVKSYNPTVYQELTGVALAPTLETLRLAQEMGVPTWVRFVLVPGVTDDEDDIRALAGFLRGFSVIEKVEVLPFHKLGEFKWAELGLTYELANTPPPTEAELQRAQVMLEV
ncbi:MAG: pyruvate formate-lyase-activating protein [Oscillospiraceae bacterium]|nr:pyruvate formate-lyase-activating protein [Oscillospiraceae bacterium]